MDLLQLEILDDLTKYQVYQRQLDEREKHSDPVWKKTVGTLQQLATVKGLYNQRKMIDDAMFYCAFFGISLAFLQDSRLKTLVSASTLLLELLLWKRYEIQALISVNTYRVPPNTKFYHRRSGLLPSFLLEAVICLLHIPPGLHYGWQSTQVYTLSMGNPCPEPSFASGLYCNLGIARNLNQFACVVLLRFYLLGRFIRNRSGFHSRQVAFIGSLNNVDTSAAWFSIKFIFRRHPGFVTVTALAIVWLSTSLTISTIERDTNDEIGGLADAFWLTIVTMSTTGYGDIYPITNFGQSAIVVGGILVGAMSTAILTAVLVDSLSICGDEQRVLDVVTRQRWTREHRFAAAALLKAAWRVRCLRKSRDKTRLPVAMRKLYNLTNRMRLVRLAIPFQEGLQDDVLRHCHTDLQQGVSMQAHRELIAVRDALRTISVKYLTK